MCERHTAWPDKSLGLQSENTRRPSMIETKAYKREVKRFTGCSLLFLFIVLILGQAGRNAAAVENSEYFKSPEQCFFPKIPIRDDAVRAGILYDMSSQAIIWEKNMNQAFPIASLTKMMVVLLAMEDIRSGKVRWNTMVTIAPEATRVGGCTVSLRPGRPLSVEDLMKAALISSGNDAAYQLALFLGKTEGNFVRRMNHRAVELGMNSTRYSNPTGMPAAKSSDDNQSSPADLLLLCKEMYKYKDLMRIAGTREELIYQGGRVIKLRNHNHLVAGYHEVDGFKTGYTANAKFCLAATASKEGRRTISIALGASSRHVRDQFVKNLFCRYYDALGMGSLEPKGEECRTVAKAIAKNPGASSRGLSATVVHRVKKGDSLSGIARGYGCSVAQLKSWNRLNGNMIKPGRQLKMYSKSNAVRVSTGKRNPSSVIYYTVKPGDTLWRISQKYNGLTVEKLMKINKIRQAMDLKTGDTIKIHLDRDMRLGKVL
jgi:D-alanyl-D-alanine carboxypeptidase